MNAPSYSYQCDDSVGNKSTVGVLLVGPWKNGEFAEILSPLSMSADWQRTASCEEAAALLQETEFAPELILLACPLPDTYLDADVEQLLLAAPLARLVVVAGTWCEGELRTGTPLSGVLRLYWYEFPGWWTSAINTLGHGGCPPWSQPLDGPHSGRCLDTIQAELTGVVAIDCKLISTFDALAGALGPYKAECHWARRGQFEQLPSQVTAGIWDGGQLEPLELERLRIFAQEICKRGGRVIALLDFPRQEHLAMVRDAGGSAVMGKPYVVEELVSRLLSLQ
ncbi:hypothetical protein [Bythopirellula goksoeyrii]|uniref:Uncharacterized protein n=1 Tax=Bythopirellula goksoeyrii TaxID=1400387 RepID=A0A5B9Q8V7_9BACT|nr:hypothetical protein [Bythopirellula goksoeyrii]QEG34119.1 hypothetical protein Pr1d_13910 [Bythopirellula goksoeyrii]